MLVVLYFVKVYPVNINVGSKVWTNYGKHYDCDIDASIGSARGMGLLHEAQQFHHYSTLMQILVNRWCDRHRATRRSAQFKFFTVKNYLLAKLLPPNFLEQFWFKSFTPIN